MTLPDDIIVAVLAYHAAHKANEDAHAAYVVAAKNFAEGQDGVLGSLGEACDTAFDVRQAAQITLVLAVERMGVAK